MREAAESRADAGTRRDDEQARPKPRPAAGGRTEANHERREASQSSQNGSRNGSGARKPNQPRSRLVRLHAVRRRAQAATPLEGQATAKGPVVRGMGRDDRQDGRGSRRGCPRQARRRRDRRRDRRRGGTEIWHVRPPAKWRPYQSKSASGSTKGEEAVAAAERAPAQASLRIDGTAARPSFGRPGRKASRTAARRRSAKSRRPARKRARLARRGRSERLASTAGRAAIVGRSRRRRRSPADGGSVRGRRGRGGRTSRTRTNGDELRADLVAARDHQRRRR